MSRRVFVVGVGMTKFEKPGSRSWDYPDMGKEAGEKALADAGIPYAAVQQACVGYVYGDSTCGQRAVYGLGLTGIPVYNVNNNCSTGSTALYMAYQFIKGGVADCVLAMGFEKMERGSLQNKYNDRTNPMDKHVGVMAEKYGFGKAPFAAQLFGNAGREHMEKYGTKPEHFAKIAEKNHRHSANNPYSQFRDIYTLEQILKSPVVHEPLTKLQCCPTSDGAGAAVVVSEDFVLKYGLQRTAVEIIGMAMATDLPSSFEEQSAIKVVGFDMTKKAAGEVYAQTGLGPKDVQVIELHDCFSTNELITYEALGLCDEGKAGELVDRGDVTYGGKYVVNPSGGLISKGHPLGATGLAQCAELCWQLRGLAEKRQVAGAQVALQHNLGLGGAAVVTMYRRPDFTGAKRPAGAPRMEALGAAPKAAPAAPAPAEQKKPAAGSAAAGSSKAAAFFAGLEKRLNADLVRKVGVVYRFDVDGASYVVNLRDGAGSVTHGAGEADCTFTMSEANLLQLMSGKLNPQTAFMQGKLKIKGNMAKAMKLQLIMAPAAAM